MAQLELVEYLKPNAEFVYDTFNILAKKRRRCPAPLTHFSIARATNANGLRQRGHEGGTEPFEQGFRDPMIRVWQCGRLTASCPGAGETDARSNTAVSEVEAMSLIQFRWVAFVLATTVGGCFLLACSGTDDDGGGQSGGGYCDDAIKKSKGCGISGGDTSCSTDQDKCLADCVMLHDCDELKEADATQTGPAAECLQVCLQ
jgi:hypothetical protein